MLSAGYELSHSLTECEVYIFYVYAWQWWLCGQYVSVLQNGLNQRTLSVQRNNEWKGGLLCQVVLTHDFLTHRGQLFTSKPVFRRADLTTITILIQVLLMVKYPKHFSHLGNTFQIRIESNTMSTDNFTKREIPLSPAPLEFQQKANNIF